MEFDFWEENQHQHVSSQQDAALGLHVDVPISSPSCAATPFCYAAASVLLSIFSSSCATAHFFHAVA